MTDDAEALSEDADGFYKAYEEHSKVLRTWLVAYGIGAPVLLATNDRLAQRMAGTSSAAAISLCFLTGVVLQVGLAVLNKTAMWACYYAVRHPENARGKRRFGAAGWISEQFWIDFLVDIATLVAFTIATWRALSIVIPPMA